MFLGTASNISALRELVYVHTFVSGLDVHHTAINRVTVVL
jgi:hypothetical protein